MIGVYPQNFEWSSACARKSIVVLYIQPTIMVGIVGWIYRTKIDPIPSFIPLFPYFFEQ